MTKLGLMIISGLLTILIGTVGWLGTHYIEVSDARWTQQMVMESEKLNQIAAITITTDSLAKDVGFINDEIKTIKKNRKSIDEKLNYFAIDIRNLCKQIKRYGDSVNWVNHPECKVDDL
jgi:hypothetical protein